MKLYIAGPLFNEMERRRNEEIASMIEAVGIVTYLPQRDGGVFSDEVKNGVGINSLKKEIFYKDIQAIQSCDYVLALLDGGVLDEGMCIELGIAFASKKKCFGYLTDTRTFNKEGINLMVEGILENIFTTRDDLVNFFSNL